MQVHVPMSKPAQSLKGLFAIRKSICVVTLLELAVYSLVGDNVDLESVKQRATLIVRDMEKHMFHLIAAFSRVPRLRLEQ